MSSRYVALDAPEWGHADLQRLWDLLPVIRSSARERWASVRSDPMPAYRLWVEPTDAGVAIGYRPRGGDGCEALEFVRAAIRGTVDHPWSPQSELCVDVCQEYVHLPCGTRAADAWLEDLWRQTGADVPGERAVYTCPCGGTHEVVLAERSKVEQTATKF
tara:strand:- start:13 stop:492 length:480 start_codon:yes stop_codon:yes gene_type:complete